MKILLSDKEKQAIPVMVIVLSVILCIMNRMYVKITDIAYINSEPYEIEIKCGFIFPERIKILVTTGEIIKSRNHTFQFKNKDFYKDGKKVITLKTDDQYQKTKTTPLVKI